MRHAARWEKPIRREGLRTCLKTKFQCGFQGRNQKSSQKPKIVT